MLHGFAEGNSMTPNETLEFLNPFDGDVPAAWVVTTGSGSRHYVERDAEGRVTVERLPDFDEPDHNSMWALSGSAPRRRGSPPARCAPR
jgi:hypothetical protein